MLNGFELIIKRPNLGQPCLVKNESGSDRINFDVLLAGKRADIDVKLHLKGKLFLQNLGGTREIWQNKFCGKLTDKTEFFKNFDMNNWPEEIRSKLIPLEVVEWEPPLKSVLLADFHDPILYCILSVMPDIDQDMLFEYIIHPFFTQNTILELLEGVDASSTHPKWINLLKEFLKYEYIYRAKLSIDYKYLSKYPKSSPFLVNLIQKDNISCENLSRNILNIYFHSVYIHNNDWHEFNFIHATDSHIALRNDNFLRELVKKGAVMPSGGEDELGSKKLALKSADPRDKGLPNWDENPNYNFRRFIKKANSMHQKGLLDFIILTGDLIDFIYNSRGFSEDRWEPSDNFRLFTYLITGWQNSESFVAENEIESPIFTMLGNHDYRFKEYPILGAPGMFWIDFFYQYLHYYEQFGLSYDEALAYMSQEAKSWTDYEGKTIPTYSPDEGLLFQRHLKEPPREYLNLVNPDKDFVVKLGNHKIICMDAGPDKGEFKDQTEAIGYKTGLGTLDKSRVDFAEHDTDSEGFTEEQICFVKEKMSGPSGLTIFAIHNPLVNYRETPPPRWFRETERPKQKKSNEAFQNYGKDMTYPGTYLGAPVANPDGWSQSDEPYFKRGNRDCEKKCLIGCGAVDDRFDEFMDLIYKCENKNAKLILSGHIEKPIEYIVRINGSSKEYYHDYYLDNKVFGVSPSHYWRVMAPDSGIEELIVEDYEYPLSRSPNPKEWWLKHSPLHVQNIGLGFPGSNRDPEKFPHHAGFLVIKVEKDVIKSIEREYIVPSISNSLKNAGKKRGFIGQIKVQCLAKDLGFEPPISIRELIKEIYLLPNGWK